MEVLALESCPTLLILFTLVTVRVCDDSASLSEDGFNDVWKGCEVPDGFFPFRMPWFCKPEDANKRQRIPIPAHPTDLQYPIRGHVFSDADFSELSCEFPSPIPWQELRDLADRITRVKVGSEMAAVCNANTITLNPLQPRDSPGNFFIPPLYGLLSDHTSDCAFGVLSYVLVGFLCLCARMQQKDMEDATMRANLRAWWYSVCLQLEGLFFYVEVPLWSIAASSWPIFELFRFVGVVLQGLEGAPPNMCDAIENPDTSEMLESMKDAFAIGNDPSRFTKAAEIALHFLDTHEDAELWKNCFFASAAAIMMLEPGSIGSGRMKVAQQIIVGWESQNKERYFWDFFTTQWPLWQLGTALKDRLRVRTAQLGFEQRDHLLSSEGHPRPVSWPALQKFDDENTWDNLPEVDFTWPWHYTSQHVGRALHRLKNRSVLFMSTWQGSERQHSYAMRARQIARGLRRGLGLHSQTCLTGCQSCCDRLAICLLGNRPGCSMPSVIVHIKGLCECATRAFSRDMGVVHVLDTIDTWVMSPPISNSMEGVLDPYKEVSGLFSETSISAQEYAQHPSVKAFRWQVFHLPHHHTNLARRTIECRDQVLRVGVHATQMDPELRAGIENLLATRFPETTFEYINPSLRFDNAKKYSPNPWSAQIAEEILDQLLSFDVTLTKVNCYEPTADEYNIHHFRFRAWLCERHQGGQRLVHAFAAGLPTVVWGGSQGFLDAVSDSKLVPLAYSNEEMVQKLGDILENKSFRCALSEEGKRLAEPYHMDRTIERYALAFDYMVERLQEELGQPTPQFDVNGWGSWRLFLENPPERPADGGVRRRGN